MPPNFSLQTNLDSLTNASQWGETHRSPARAVFDMDETQWKEFLRSTETTSPVGDTFAHELRMIGETRLLMMQTVFPGEQIANRQQLQINFGTSVDPENEFAASLSPSFADAKIQFNFDLNGEDWKTTDAMCMNVPFYEPQDGFDPHEFTPAGTELIECLLQQKERVLAVAGLHDEDHSMLERMLRKIEKDKQQNKLRPTGWMTT